LPTLRSSLYTPPSTTDIYTLSLHDALPIYLPDITDQGEVGVINGDGQIYLISRRRAELLIACGRTSRHGSRRRRRVRRPLQEQHRRGEQRRRQQSRPDKPSIN